MDKGVSSIFRPDDKLSSSYDDDSIKRVTAIFKRFDTNGDGKISYAELAYLFQEVDPEHWNESAVKQLLKAIDTNHDGTIKYEELLQWIMGKDEYWSEARQAIFLKGSRCFCPGDIVSINQQVEAASRDPYEVEIDLSKGGKLGVVLDSPDSKTLLIKAVKDGGLLAGWNAENCDCQVTVGAQIIEITATVYTNRFEKNSKGQAHVEEYKARCNPREMVALLKKPSSLKLLVKPCGKSNTFALKLADNYEELSTLHEGVRAVVKKVKHRRTDSVCCVKSVAKTRMNKDAFVCEFEARNILDHPNVLRLLEVYEDFHCIHQVLQMCDGGELLEQVLEYDTFNEQQAARCVQQVMAAVRYLHSQSICHRDIKAENVLLESACYLDRALLKLIDFGNACRFDPNVKMKTALGCSEYRSIEMIGVGQPGYTCLCDVWSCGILMYLLLGGYPPFMGETDRETLQLIRKADIYFGGSEWAEVSDDAKDLIKALLSPEASRLSADEALQHQWIKESAPRANGGKLENTYANIRAFSGQCRLKKLARYALAKTLNVDEVENLRREFETIDKNGDGTVTFHEFRATLDRMNDKCAEQMRLQFEAADVNGSKRIEYTEFLAAALDQRLHCEEQGCWMAFNAFDRDGSGMISKKELKDILENSEKCSALSEPFNGAATADSVARCLAECDSDMDGELDFVEFLALMRGESSKAEVSRL